MNAFDYDAGTGRITINNLPFDGAGETEYELNPTITLASTDASITGDPNFAQFLNARVYENVKTGNTAQDRYYAVLIKSDNMVTGSIATPVYADFGYGGAVIKRITTGVTMPSGEALYTYAGVYAGQRVFSDRGGLEIVQGNATLELDTRDFDITGAVRGDITDRVRVFADNSRGASLPDIELVITDDGLDGKVESGIAQTQFTNQTTGIAEIRDTGEYTATFGGPNGEELGGFVIIEGVAAIRNVTYDVATLADGTRSTLSEAQVAQIQQALRQGIDPPSLTTYDTSDASNTDRGTETAVFKTEGNARETGVFLTKRKP